MLNQFSRMELIIGKKNIEKLNNAKVAVFGLGGVGAYVVEGLVRAGIQNFILVDNDEYSLTNLNRQLYATHKTISMAKVNVARDRILEINPNAKVEIHKVKFMPETDGIIDESINYIIDAIDTVTAKIELVLRANKYNIPIISCMGTGNKIDPTKLQVSDIYKTKVCPLAKVMRKELKLRNIPNLKVVYSEEEPIKPNEDLQKEYQIEEGAYKSVPGSVSFVPSVAGLIMAGEVVKDLI